MNKWTVGFIILFLAIPQVALDLYLPSLPSMKLAFHTTTTLVQLTIPAYVLAVSIGQFNFGPLSDSIGRRPVVILGITLFIIGSIFTTLTHNIDMLLIGRFIQGLGMGFGAIISRAILRDICHDKKIYSRIVTYQYLTWSTVPMLAPIFGGYIERYTYWRVNFYVLLTISVLLLITVLLKLPETKDKKQRQPFHPIKVLKNYLFVMKQFEISAYTLLISSQYWLILSIIQLSPFIIQDELGFSPNAYGWLLMVIGCASLIGGLLNKFACEKFNLKSIITTAVIIMFVIAIANVLLSMHWFNVWVVIIPLFLIRFSAGFNYSNCVSLVMEKHPELAGTISAFFGVTISFTAGIVTLLIAHIPIYKQWGLTSTLFVELCFMILVLAVIHLKNHFRP